MDLKIHSITNSGNAAEEHVTLEVIADTDLKNYMIADTTYVDDTSISNKLRHTYWFVSKSVKKGDFVRLHTGPGTPSSPNNNAKTKTHHFYWGLGKGVWNDTGDVALLLQVTTWRTKKVG
ncbi:MAG TPA: hypothetical protein VGC35_07365 [Allosphingosinicella sp.]|jgi:hypothetical protein